MPPVATLTSLPQIHSLREHYRQEMSCQITHDSIHYRTGWSLSYLLRLSDLIVGYGTVAIAGPWKDRPTVIEFFVLPDHRTRVFDLFATFLAASGARFIEVQSNATLLTNMLHAWSGDAVSESVVFHDTIATALPPNGAILKRVTSEEETRACIECRSGGTEWILDVDGTTVAKGGIMFHYNRPYGDIYMDVAEPFRRRGFGSYLVQELKRVSYALGHNPCARCNPNNIASRQTLQKAGFVPCAHILTGSIRPG